MPEFIYFKQVYIPRLTKELKDANFDVLAISVNNVDFDPLNPQVIVYLNDDPLETKDPTSIVNAHVITQSELNIMNLRGFDKQKYLNELYVQKLLTNVHVERSDLSEVSINSAMSDLQTIINRASGDWTNILVIQAIQREAQILKVLIRFLKPLVN